MNPTTIVSISNDDDFENSFFEPRSNTRKQRKQSRAKKRGNRGALQTTGLANDNVPNISLQMKPIYPKTENQDEAFTSYANGKNLFMSGFPGTGKTFLGIYLALNTILNHKTHQKQLII